MSTVKRAYLYRFYPTDKQKNMLARTCGCVRYTYNWALRLSLDTYQATGKGLSYQELSAQLTVLKQQEDTSFLHEVSCVPVQQSLRHLKRAYVNFFAGRAKYPTFKKRRGSQSAEYTRSAFTWEDRTLTLAKMDAPLAIVWSRPLPDGAQPSTVTGRRDQTGRYFVSMLVEEEMVELAQKDKQIGVDLGLKTMVATSDGHTCETPKYAARDEKKLAHAQRRLSHKHKGSKNRDCRRGLGRVRAATGVQSGLVRAKRDQD